MTPVSSPTQSTQRAALIHREVIRLVALVFVAVAAFVVTRAVAMNNRDLSVRNAAEWYRRGERLVDEGRLDDAIDAFRRATVRNRTNRTYLLALSRALVQKRDYDAARNILLTVRESAPEDAEINLDLARLSAARQDVTEATRFFHDALYAPWPANEAEKRRAVRIELIRFLLTHHQASRAQSELVAAAVDMPDDVGHHLEVAHLFYDVGDARNSLAHFQRAVQLAPENQDALVGAGKAAFDVGRFALARRYLAQVSSDTEPTREMRQIADLVLSSDPMATRIGARERHRRLEANLSFAEQRFTDCLSRRATAVSAGDQGLENELRGFERQLQRSSTLDQDTIESGVDLIERAERIAVTSCGPASTFDQALLLIASQHGEAPR
jgi:tetratricopeptide (TPR) repeat protein